MAKPDAESDIMSKKLENGKNNFRKIRFVKNLPLDIYVSIKSLLLYNRKFTSALREGSFIGVPAVNIGSRQNKRLTGKNIINCENDQKKFIILLLSN